MKQFLDNEHGYVMETTTLSFQNQTLLDPYTILDYSFFEDCTAVDIDVSIHRLAKD